NRIHTPRNRGGRFAYPRLIATTPSGVERPAGIPRCVVIPNDRARFCEKHPGRSAAAGVLSALRARLRTVTKRPICTRVGWKEKDDLRTSEKMSPDPPCPPLAKGGENARRFAARPLSSMCYRLCATRFSLL